MGVSAGVATPSSRRGILHRVPGHCGGSERDRLLPLKRGASTEQERLARTAARVRETVRFCGQRRNLTRTVRIALVVGVLLTAINQGGVLLGGRATAVTWIRCGLNFLVPFLVSNAGLISGRR